MAIRKGSKVVTEFGASAMTDMMFLLLIFLMVATTLINSNALKILLPKSSNQVTEKPKTTVSVTEELIYFVDKVQMPFEDVESYLQVKHKNDKMPIIMLNMDKRITVDELTKVMNIATRNKYSIFLMTQP